MKNYPQYYEHLMASIKALNSQIPDTMSGFRKLHQAGTNTNLLSKKTKELMALSIAVNVRCDGCIAFHVHDALKAGASDGEIIETLGVAIMMGGGPSLMYACEALEALNQFSEINKNK